MAETLAELGFNEGVEVGVAHGQHSEILCKANPKLKLHLVDIWMDYEGYTIYTGRTGKYYRIAKRRLIPYDCVWIQKFSMDAVKDFDDESLDFVYIDAAHDFQNVVNDICEWTKKVKIGGVVFGHDYRRTGNKWEYAIEDAVIGYCNSKVIKPWFILGEPGHRDGMYKEGIPSWMFVRQDGDRT